LAAPRRITTCTAAVLGLRPPRGGAPSRRLRRTWRPEGCELLTSVTQRTRALARPVERFPPPVLGFGKSRGQAHARVRASCQDGMRARRCAPHGSSNAT